MDGLLALDGELGGLVARHDWAATQLGSVDRWPESLKTMVGFMLLSPVPMVLLWGEDGVMLYNDAYSEFAGNRHPALLGSKVREGWPEIADFNDNVMKVGLAGGRLAYRDQELTLHRHGGPDQVFMDLDYSPVLDENGRPAGVLAIVLETTGRVAAERRQSFVVSLGDALRDVAEPTALTTNAAQLLGRHLGVGRAGYGEIDATGEVLSVARDWTDGHMSSLAGEARVLDAFGPEVIAALRAGNTLVVEDCLVDPRTSQPDYVTTWESIGTRALIVTPLLDQGRPVAVLYAHSAAPRVWSELDVRLVDDVAARTWEAVKRARAEAALRQSDERQRFLLDLGDQTRSLADAEAIIATTMRALGQRLGADRVAYAEIDETSDRATISSGDWTSSGTEHLPRELRLSGFGAPMIGHLRAGRTLRVDDASRHPDTVDSLETLDAIGVRAIVSVPLLKDGRFLANVNVHQRTPRAWTDAETELIEAVSERTWDAIQRARAEDERARAAALSAAQNRILELAVAEAPLGQTLEAIAATVEDLSSSGVLASILLLDQDGRHLRHGAGPSLPAAYNQAIDGIAVGPEVGSCGTAVHTRAPVFVSDIGTDPFWKDFRDLALSHGLRACWSIPILSGKGRVLGTFAMYYRQPRQPNPVDLQLVEFVVRSAGLVISRHRIAHARKTAEASLRDSEERLRLATENAEVGFWDVDEVNQILHWPPSVKAMFGISANVPVTMADFYAGLHPDDAGAAGDAYAAAADPARRALYDVEYRTIGKEDRVVRWVAAKGRGVFDGAGRCLRVAGTAIDITRRRAAEERLRESEARFRLTADAVPQIVWITDADGRVEFFNRQWSEYTGAAYLPATSTEVSANHLHPDDRAMTNAAFDDARRTGTTFLVEHRIRSATGEYRWFLVRGEPYRDPQSGQIIRWFGASVDIHDRRLAENALRELNETLERRVADALAERQLLAQFVDSTDVAVLACDLDFGILAINAATVAQMERVYGLHLRVGDNLLGMLDAMPEHRAQIESHWGRALAGEEFSILEEFGDPGRERAYYEVRFHALRDHDGQRIGAFQAASDVTDRVRAQAEIDRIWRNAADIFVALDSDGRFQRVNPAVTAILGWTEGEMAGRSVFDFIHPDDVNPSAAALERVNAVGDLPTFENRYRTKDGKWRSISWLAASEGATVLAYGRDVTAEKERQEELRTVQEALRQSQKMEAMGQLTGGVAHDFNNLLTPIVGSLDMLQRKGIGNEREQRLIAGAAQSAERAKLLVQRLLAFARRQPLQPVPVDIGKLVAGMGDLVSSTTGPQIEVVVQAGEDLPAAKADPNQLEMALLNLAVNARDAMPGGGTLRLSATTEKVGAGHRSGLTSGTYIKLSVADTGVGMDEATLARAIEPFFSTKGVGKGTGLGLSMVHGLASQLGGALTIQSRPKLGTNIELWLPQSAAVAKDPATAVATSGAVASRGIALLVDDEELVRMSTADMLSDLGYGVIEAASGEEAMRLIAKGERFDLLLTDHLMPGISGTDLARVVRSARPNVPVLLVSGYAESEGVDADLPRLTKPFRKDELAASLVQLSRLI